MKTSLARQIHHRNFVSRRFAVGANDAILPEEMPTVTACSVFVDTNVLVYQTFEDFEPDKHALVTSTLQQLID